MEEQERQTLIDIFYLLTEQLKEQKRIRYLLDIEHVFGEEKPE